MSKEQTKLDGLRQEIDALDDQLHDLLMRRANLASDVAKAKGKAPSDGLAFRPGREAQVLRRLVGRHAGPLQPSFLLRIWREIFAAMTALQGPFSVAVLSVPGNDVLRRLSEAHFGGDTPLQSFETARGVLRAVSEGEVGLGVLSLPEDGEENPWWIDLPQGGDQTLKVVARLPFLNKGPATPEALVVGRFSPDPSGQDRSLFLLAASEPLSRAGLRALFEKHGLKLCDFHVADSGARRLVLIELDQPVAEAESALASLQAEDPKILEIHGVGGYALPMAQTSS